MIGKYCREYREKCKVTLIELGGEDQVKNLSAFEHGRSSNIKHLEKYIKLSKVHGDSVEFLIGLGEIINE